MLASWVSQASFSPPGLSIAVAKDRSVESLLQKGDSFALNILSEKDFREPLKRFTKPFSPGEDRFEGLDIELTPNDLRIPFFLLQKHLTMLKTQE